MIQVYSKLNSKYCIAYLKTNLRGEKKNLIRARLFKDWQSFQALKYCFKYFFKKESSLKMTKTAVVVIVALLASLLFSGPDPMLYYLPALALAVGPVIILFPVTEENAEFFVRSSECWILEFPQTESYNTMLNCILQTWPSFSFALQLELSADKKETP